MEQKINYKQLFDMQLNKIKQKESRPSLLLHACCAPCSSYVLEYLCDLFDITLFFYNPNIAPEKEYLFRAEELIRLVNKMPLNHKPTVIVPPYDPSPFDTLAKGKELLPERGSRCTDCYYTRLEQTYKKAAEGGFDFFSTTLSISPHKDAKRLNDIGSSLASGGGTEWLYSDFKKNEGYKRSIQLSEQYSLYRQNYCGCVYSKKD